MSLPVATRVVPRCLQCHAILHRSYASFTATKGSLPRRTGLPPPTRPPRRHRLLSTTSRNLSDNATQQESGHTPGLAGVDEVNGTLHPEQDESPSDTSDLPWYLQPQSQEQTERDLPKRIADSQRLPDLPPRPPPILHTLLEHVSIDLGLDDLTLLDLRDLDPPPALGSNLLMLIGTARSEKHLHVSADRFCRYLRSTHALRPHADGLLGRGELKVKLRRMAKRARLLANVGVLDHSKPGEDLRTGWVCVMVDGIEPSQDAEPQKAGNNIVGFDERSDKVTLVVQMFTEEKRQEIGIEKLWTGRSERAVLGLAPAEEEEDLPEDQDVVQPERQSGILKQPENGRMAHREVSVG